MVETKGDDETSRKVFVKSGSLNGLVRILTSHSVIGTCLVLFSI